jgi:PAS domain S-box-containing protein
MITDDAKQLVSHEMMREQITGLVQTGQAPFLKRPMSTHIRRRDGEVRIVEQTIFPISIGSRLHYGSIVRDVTEAKRTEKMLRDSEKKYRDIVNATNDALFVVDMQGRFLEVNDSACRQLGYTRGELLCRGPMTICPPEHADKTVARMKEVVNRGHYVFETTHMTKDGRRIPVEISAQRLTYQGTPALLGVVRDISERSRVLEALVQSEEKYRVIFNNEV